MGLMFARRRMDEKKARAKARVEDVAKEVLPPPPAEEKKPAEPLVLERPGHAAKIEKAKDQQRRAIARDSAR